MIKTGVVLNSLIMFSLLFIGPRAIAFDPTSIISGASAISGIVGGIDKVDEMADLGFSLVDLLTDLGLDPGGEDGVNAAVERLEELNTKAKDLRWSSKEIRESIEIDLSNTKSVKERINALRKMIAASQKIATIMGVRPKAGERASQIQMIKINSMILEELQAQRRQELLAYLEGKEAQRRRDIYIQEIREKEGNRPFWSRQ